MQISRHFLGKVLLETTQDYEEATGLRGSFKLGYIDEDTFIQNALANKLIKLQCSLGVYEDFAKEYPNFVMVFRGSEDNVITVCYERAARLLKPFKTRPVRQYLKYIFAHEMTHWLEIHFAVQGHPLWIKADNESKGEPSLRSEILAEDVALLVAKLPEIHGTLWATVNKRVNHLRQRRESKHES